jgi:hypothetical protein
VAERVYLVRYLNSLVFLCAVLENPEHYIALNRIETHPVGNRFGLAQLQSRGENTYIRFLLAFGHLQILSATLRNCGLKSPARQFFLSEALVSRILMRPSMLYLIPLDWHIHFILFWLKRKLHRIPLQLSVQLTHALKRLCNCIQGFA